MRRFGKIERVDRQERIVQVLSEGQLRELDFDLFGENRYLPTEKSGLEPGAEIEFGFEVVPQEGSPDIPNIDHFARVLNVPMESDEWIKEGL